MKAIVRAVTTSGRVRLLTEDGQSVRLEARRRYLRTGDIVFLSHTVNGLSIKLVNVEDVLPVSEPEPISIPKEDSNV